jgi:hypothetical protein
MPTLSLTNQRASQALRGEDVIVTLSTAALSNLASLEVGQYCQISGLAVYGTVSRIDNYGTTFEVKPIEPDMAFASTPGYLAASQVVLVTT